MGTAINSVRSLAQLMEYGSATLVGELLRELTFPEQGASRDCYGCYTTFKVRDDAETWSHNKKVMFWHTAKFHEPSDVEEEQERANMGDGYTFNFMDLIIDVCWYWDGDGTLVFKISNNDDQFIRAVLNDDCKKDYVWEELEINE